MISVRKSEDRGHAEHGWLTTNHTFSFADYYDPHFMGFRTLRVINQDIIAAAKGFDTHPHKDMEILTYIIDGTIAHKDTMGNESQIQKGEFQLMSAGKGVQHSEFNPSKNKQTHLLQIWIQPEKKGLTPEYQQKSFAEHKQGLKLVVSPDGKEGSLKIHQDARIYLGRFDKAEKMSYATGSNRHVWVQLIHGSLNLNGESLKTGDGAFASYQKELIVEAEGGTEFLLFDLN
ncbi:MAG: quercetin 2,3-dioxygenase [Chlamydiae bacterium RIFCSPHIGHO2_12_FULL_49_9]|nr:MAG: quercetin 2,3-dioxygenase [Chlamydiae bacterium RIFCSPHIGHO2_12_FULL_49_9]